jgi:hypothetical protein
VAEGDRRCGEHRDGSEHGLAQRNLPPFRPTIHERAAEGPVRRRTGVAPIPFFFAARRPCLRAVPEAGSARFAITLDLRRFLPPAGRPGHYQDQLVNRRPRGNAGDGSASLQATIRSALRLVLSPGLFNLRAVGGTCPERGQLPRQLAERLLVPAVADVGDMAH